MEFIDAMRRTADSTTANGCVTNSTSLDACLDLFFIAGACRCMPTEDIDHLILKAYEQDRIKCLKIIFWAGDIRQGAGERRFFKIALKWLLLNHKDDMLDYLNQIVDLNRWDSLFYFADNKVVLSFILSVLLDPLDPRHALLCKWLPRKKQYNNLADKIRRTMKITPKQYRKLLVGGTDVVENRMCKKQWNEIEYAHVPSVAMNKYTKAWYRNDAERVAKYIKEVNEGKKKINADAILPSDIIKAKFNGAHSLNEAQITQWNNLPNYLTGINSIIPVCDVSGSMWGPPLVMSLALGLYISERNEGPFKDAFFTFSQMPKLQVLSGDLNSRMRQMEEADWGYNTNLSAVFSLILSQAKRHNLSQQLMPKTVLVISDMEFDSCTDMTQFEDIKQQYKQSGYIVPNIVFWNVNGRVNNLPIQRHESGAALVSGASPSILKSVLANDINPLNIMNTTIEKERYNFIKI